MKIIILIPYFGGWPPWFQYFLQTCQANPEINWLIYSNSSSPVYSPDNVYFVNGSLEDFSLLASKKLNLTINLIRPYKICDLRPSFGKIFEDYIHDYDFWGYSDLDLFYGSIGHFIKKDLLENYDIISVRKHYFTGHLAFYRNNEKVNNLYKYGYRYKSIFKNTTKHFAFDEKLNIYGKNLFSGKQYLGICSRLKRLIIKIKYWLIKTALRYPMDMNEIIREEVNRNHINYYSKDMVRSDLWFHKNEVSNWEIIWDHGVLKDNNNKNEILHFHIIESKKNENFTIDKWGPNNCFRISNSGISLVN